VNKLAIKRAEDKDLTSFCVSGKDQPFTATTLEGDVRTLPLSTTKPRYQVSRLAQEHLSILIRNILFRKAIKTLRI
jgi:hypothetical protein